jgi:hypothetical protein
MLLTRKANASAMNGISPYHVKDFVVFVRRRPKSLASGRDIVEQILNGYLCATSACDRFGIWRLTGFGRRKFATVEVSTPSTTGIFGLRCYCQTGNVTNASQSLASETIGTDAAQILELLELGGGESLTEYWEILFLGQISRREW